MKNLEVSITSTGYQNNRKIGLPIHLHLVTYSQCISNICITITYRRFNLPSLYVCAIVCCGCAGCSVSLSLGIATSSAFSTFVTFERTNCSWLEAIGLIAGIGTHACAGSQTLQSIILLCTGTNKDGGHLAPKWLFLCIYMGLTFIWALRFLFLQLISRTVIVMMLPLIAQSASFVFSHFEMAESTSITSKPYAVILAFLVCQYSLYGYDAAAHLTEETKGADKNSPIAILTSIGIISVFGWAYIMVLTFSIQDFNYLYDPSTETAGVFVPAQILYDAFHGRYHNATGAIILLFIIWGSFFFGGLSITLICALSRDKGIPFSPIWRKVHPKHKVPSNAVWLCVAICILYGIPILKVNVVFTAITSICTMGWVRGYAVPIFTRMASRLICLTAFLWICYTCSVFLLSTLYPITQNRNRMIFMRTLQRHTSRASKSKGDDSFVGHVMPLFLWIGV
ncbi:hypothetical protein ACJRO7_033646 [Eucalyptus globulus]|uniref:Uncharacterized protein n=1 Tax=Eucalyptus globulus TaxID=34317 RepID=A0ABD3JM09_EUCGL